MASGKSLSVSVLAILASVALCNCLHITYEYLEEPRGVNAFDDTVEGLNKMDLNGVTTPEQMSKAMDAFNKSLPNDYWRIEVRLWTDLTKPVKNCAPYWLNNLIYNYYVVERSTEIQKKQVFLDFMEHFGRKKVEKCVPEALTTMKTAKNSQGVLDAVQFFKGVTSLEDGASDRDLYQKLKPISVSDADWNVQFLATEVYKHDKSERDSVDAKDRYHFLFVNHCRKFNAELGASLKVINVAAVLNSGEDYFKGDDSLQSLREVGRICLDLSRFEDGFHKNLSAKMGLK